MNQPDLPELLILRHGETLWNREGRFQGALDSALTPAGREQARAMGLILDGLGVDARSHDALTSPQGRAMETARLAVEPLGLVARPDVRLAEYGMGEWIGLRYEDVARRWPGPAAEAVHDLYARAPGGEGIAAATARLEALLASLARPTILVTHGFVRRLLCARAIGVSPRDIDLSAAVQGSVIRIRCGVLDVVAAPAALPGQAGAGSRSPMGG